MAASVAERAVRYRSRIRQQRERIERARRWLARDHERGDRRAVDGDRELWIAARRQTLGTHSQPRHRVAPLLLPRLLPRLVDEGREPRAAAQAEKQDCG